MWTLKYNPPEDKFHLSRFQKAGFTSVEEAFAWAVENKFCQECRSKHLEGTYLGNLHCASLWTVINTEVHFDRTREVPDIAAKVFIDALKAQGVSEEALAQAAELLFTTACTQAFHFRSDLEVTKAWSRVALVAEKFK